MLLPVLQDALRKANNLDPKLVEEVCIGNVMQAGAGASTSRMAQFLAGIPESTPLYAINRFCSSGLQAVADVANSIRGGQVEIGIGGGVESMSMYSMHDASFASSLSEQVFENDLARNCLTPMGTVSETVAEKYGITRE